MVATRVRSFHKNRKRRRKKTCYGKPSSVRQCFVSLAQGLEREGRPRTPTLPWRDLGGPGHGLTVTFSHLFDTVSTLLHVLSHFIMLSRTLSHFLHPSLAFSDLLPPSTFFYPLLPSLAFSSLLRTSWTPYVLRTLSGAVFPLSQRFATFRYFAVLEGTNKALKNTKKR